jgi:hypothetical protein
VEPVPVIFDSPAVEVETECRVASVTVDSDLPDLVTVMVTGSKTFLLFDGSTVVVLEATSMIVAADACTVSVEVGVLTALVVVAVSMAVEVIAAPLLIFLASRLVAELVGVVSDAVGSVSVTLNNCTTSSIVFPLASTTSDGKYL